MTVNMHEAKTHFSQLVNRALAGESIIIARNGTPLVQLKPVRGGIKERTAGLNRGAIRYSEEFTEPLPDEIVSEFEK